MRLPHISGLGDFLRQLAIMAAALFLGALLVTFALNGLAAWL